MGFEGGELFGFSGDFSVETGEAVGNALLFFTLWRSDPYSEENTVLLMMGTACLPASFEILTASIWSK